MRQTVTFLGLSWEVIGEIGKNDKFNLLEEKYFRLLTSKNGRKVVVVHTEKWSPNNSKDSPRFRKCYDKHLLKYLLPGEEKKLIESLSHKGYRPESELII